MNWDTDDYDTGYDEDWDDYPDEPEETGTVTCANCGEDVYEDAPNCPYCGDYLVAASRSTWDDKPTWYIILAILGIIAVIFTLLLH